MPEQKPDPWSGIRYLGIGVEFAAAVGGFAAVGYWVGGALGSRTWGLVIGAALGLIGGTYNLIRESLAAVSPLKRDESRRKEDRKYDS